MELVMAPRERPRHFATASGTGLLGAVLLAACIPQIGFDGTEYACPDGVSCPAGYRCVERVCRDDSAPPPPPAVADGAPDDAPPPPPDGADPGAPPGPLVAIGASDDDMGCSLTFDDSCARDATPRHDVSLSAYEIDVHEVTQAEYQACVVAGACTPPRARFDPTGRATFPVTDVSWDDAVAYCTFAEKRLPTEAEWEHAARGPSETAYPWGGDAPDCARATFAGCAAGPVAVGSHTDDASVFGATELAGNVAEWIGDFYDPGFYDVTPRADPTGPATGTERVVRGGSFASSAVGLFSYARGHAPPATTSAEIGFRCVRGPIRAAQRARASPAW
jgi:formylglycine-generating enzyme required for sulfatase activity